MIGGLMVSSHLWSVCEQIQSQAFGFNKKVARLGRLERPTSGSGGRKRFGNESVRPWMPCENRASDPPPRKCFDYDGLLHQNATRGNASGNGETRRDLSEI
jgi:hypothetical protein